MVFSVVLATKRITLLMLLTQISHAFTLQAIKNLSMYPHVYVLGFFVNFSYISFSQRTGEIYGNAGNF